MGSIYRITIKRTGAEYVGSTKHLNVEKRWQQHRNAMKAGRHCNAGLQRAYDEDGLDGLAFEVIESDILQRKLIATERAWQQRSQARVNRVIPGTRTHFRRDAWGNEVPQHGLF